MDIGNKKGLMQGRGLGERDSKGRDATNMEKDPRAKGKDITLSLRGIETEMDKKV